MKLYVETRNRYQERCDRSKPAPLVVSECSMEPRAYMIQAARRFAHRRPRRIGASFFLSFEGDHGDTQIVGVA